MSDGPAAVIVNEAGTNVAEVKPASTAAVAADKALVVAVSPNNTVPVSAASLPLPAGAATSALQTQPGVDIGDVTINNAAGAAAVNVQDGGNSITVDATSLPLPTGAATETTLAAVSGKLPATLGQKAMAASLAVVVASDQSAVPVSAASLPLPAGAATEATLAAQTLADNAAFTDGTSRVTPAGYILDEVAGTALTENDVAAARMDSKRSVVNVIEDATTRGQRMVVTAANAAKVDGSAVTQPVSAASLPLPTGAATEATLAAASAKLPATLGQKAMAASLAVVVASDQSAVPISAASLPLPTGAATETSLAAQSLVDNAGFTDGSSRVVPSGHVFDEVAGTALTENDVAASRVDSKRAQVLVIEDLTTRGQRLTITAANAAKVDGSAVTQPISAVSLPLPTGAATETTLAAASAKLPATLGQKAMAASLAVVLASDQSAIPVTANAGTNLNTSALALDASIVAQSVVDNAAFTDGTTRVQPVAFIFDEVAGTALTENDAAAARIDSKRAIVNVIEDGTTRGTRAAVKAASTAAVAGDPALVVSVSPNTPIVVGVSQNDVTSSGALGALNAAVSIVAAGTAGIGMQLAAGTLVGTIVPEVSTDGGTTWNAGYFFDPVTGTLATSIVFGVANTAQTRGLIIVGGVSNVRVRVSAYTSGTANCAVRATTANDPSTAIRGSDGINLRTVLLDTSGRIVTAPAGASSTASGFAFGDVQLSATTTAAVRRTTLTEQSSNAQRSISSANVNDTSAGTGARTVRITYYTSAGVGPLTETVTMNGTTAVNTVSTTICFVEKLEVMTVGSGLQNAGIITLFAATAGGGGAVCTIGATEQRTLFALHYVPTAKTCFITGMAVSNTSTASGNGASFFIRSQQLGVSNVPDVQISDLIRLFGQSSNVMRAYGTPIQVAGPARIQAWVTTEGSVNINYRASFDFYDQ